jgi:EAL and modified HD-GYP domain-containing signal transduction protein
MEIFLARQPIFDRREALAGYELLYRAGAANFAAGASPERMAADVVLHALLEFGLERITPTAPAFLNCSSDLLVGGALDLLDPERVVLEVLETVTPDAAVLAACERLVRRGFRLALDDYTPAAAALLPLASIVKIDVRAEPPEAIAETAERLRRPGLHLLAEKVETPAEHEAFQAMGFDLFQGYFYQRPEVLTGQGLSVAQMTLIRLMNRLRDEATSDAELEEAFRSDPALCHKLLRMVNAAALGGRGIDSIGHALRMLGRAALGRWLALLLVSSMGTGGLQRERVREAALRARMCELLAEKSEQAPPPGTLFLLGMFSTLDALLRVPMAELLSRISLAPGIAEALLQRSGPYAVWLELVEGYLGGRWDAVMHAARDLGAPLAELPQLYGDSLQWASEQVRLLATDRAA